MGKRMEIVRLREEKAASKKAQEAATSGAAIKKREVKVPSIKERVDLEQEFLFMSSPKDRESPLSPKPPILKSKGIVHKSPEVAQGGALK